MAPDVDARARPLWMLLGPAFVAAIAYVDPGNVAANVSAGAQFGFLLVWVIVVANVMACLVQYLSAKLGVVTGRSLPEAVGARMGRGTRLTYWVQAELVAMATDLAEVVGGAIALYLLFDLPLLVGGVITGAVSLILLLMQGPPRPERLRAGHHRPADGHRDRFFHQPVRRRPLPSDRSPRAWCRASTAPESILLAAAMLGATVMPHAVYLHSGLARDRHGHPEPAPLRTALLRATRWDVGIAMLVAGAVNLSMLLRRGHHPAGHGGHRLHRGRARRGARAHSARPSPCSSRSDCWHPGSRRRRSAPTPER